MITVKENYIERSVYSLAIAFKSVSRQILAPKHVVRSKYRLAWWVVFRQ